MFAGQMRWGKTEGLIYNMKRRLIYNIKKIDFQNQCFYLIKFEDFKIKVCFFPETQFSLYNLKFYNNKIALA